MKKFLGTIIKDFFSGKYYILDKKAYFLRKVKYLMVSRHLSDHHQTQPFHSFCFISALCRTIAEQRSKWTLLKPIDNIPYEGL